jgi:four helix bundle protein
MSNIAKGFERGGNAEFLQFLAVARGSAAEVQSLLYVAFDEEYITRDQFNDLKSLALSARHLISGLSAYLRRSSMKGEKYKRARALRTNREP